MAEIKVGKYVVKLTNQDIVLFKKPKITKGDLVNYYYKIASTMLPYVKDRLLTMQRFPDGIDGESFFQKDAPDYFPDWIKRKSVRKKAGGTIKYVVCNNAATLVYLANQACIPIHIVLSKINKLHYPDRMIFDLDPSKNEFGPVKTTAKKLKYLLENVLGLNAFVMTTGSRGLHVVVPLKREHIFKWVKKFAHDCAKILVKHDPKKLTLKVRKAERKGRIFVDILRNEVGQTGVAPYAVRAKPGAPIATPLEWSELSRLKTSQEYHIKNIFRRLSAKTDPWKDIDKKMCSLKKARKKLDELLKDE